MLHLAVLHRMGTLVSAGQNPGLDAVQVEPSSEMRKVLQAASKLQKKKGDNYLGTPVHSLTTGLCGLCRVRSRGLICLCCGSLI